VAHRLENTGPTPGRFLILATPAGIERFFAQAADMDDDPARLATLCAECGIDRESPADALDGPVPLLAGPGEGKVIPGGDHWFTTKALGTETQGMFAAMEVTTAPGGGPPPHVHRLEDEAYYMVEGELLILMGHQVVRATPGTFLFLPRDTVHAFRNVGATPARFLGIVTPAGRERFLEEAGRRQTENPSAATPAALVTPRPGLEIVSPPDDWKPG
jgi:quercetin dioxygenase-like cupin family protein